jgi:hypothetical protein
MRAGRPNCASSSTRTRDSKKVVAQLTLDVDILKEINASHHDREPVIAAGPKSGDGPNPPSPGVRPFMGHSGEARDTRSCVPLPAFQPSDYVSDGDVERVSILTAMDASVAIRA